jgi:hypothetical protein
VLRYPSLLAMSAALLVSPAEALAQFDCQPDWMPSLADTSIAGTVLERQSGRPIPSVFISLDGAPLGSTDCNGRFALPYNIPDGKHTVSTWSPYFKPASRTVKVAGPVITWLTLKLELRPPAAHPALDLAGEWDLVFFSDSGHRQGPIATARIAVGPGRSSRLGVDHFATVWLDYRLLGSPQDLLDSFPEFAPGPGGVEDSVPIHAAGDSVGIQLTPRIFDGGWSFYGRVRGTVVRGIWCERDFAHSCERSGEARLTRR